MPTSAGASYHGTLTANTVMTVTLNDDYARVEVLHRDPTSSSPIYFTTTGAANPTVAGDGTFVVMPGGALQVDVPDVNNAVSTSVQLISAGAVAFSVTGMNP